ncbi:hypothetical protein N0B30_23860 [Bacillus subtilis]|nr:MULTISPECIES: hypothetical protein [Bacillus subtilis group]MCT6515661.1 hypothetical protein [Bacillus subtilis]OCB98110.1 hypothetical protein SRCM101294_00764 [Bacillus amyloliquefaciens]
MLPDILVASPLVAAVLFIVTIVIIIRTFISQRWGMFFSTFAIICYVIVSNPGEFESIAKAIWDLPLL